MKNKKIPMRSCVVTGEKLPKKDLLRIVRTPENEVIIDLLGKSNGRGAYLKKDIEVIKRAQKNKILERHLEVKISDDLYLQMIDMVGDINE
ncbi:MAG TPA: YlxR family protein [Bacilli bacterium]|nr:YlxR family protein [Bacilli bacterium]